MSVFDAICYGLSTMSTGGFSNSDSTVDELGAFYIKIVLIFFMFLGGVNFSLLFKAVTGKFKTVFQNDVLKWYIGIVFICYVLLLLNVWHWGLIHNVDDATIDPLFRAVSILTSTGITGSDFADWGSLSTVVLIIMMVMGACAGSTSGGAKIDRFLVLFKFLRNEFFKMMHPNAITTVSINGKGTPSTVVNKTLAFLFLYIIVILVGGTLLVLIGLPLKDSFFICLSAISNTGLGTDVTGISGNYALVPDAGKWLLSFIMLVGRLELFTILLIFIPSFWRK